MNKLVTAISVLLMVVSFSQAKLQGEGTKKAPFLIQNTADLDDLRNYCGEKYKDKYFQLTQDIVFSSSDFEKDGRFYHDGFFWKPIGEVLAHRVPHKLFLVLSFEGAFQGKLNGRNHKIKGMRFGIHYKGENHYENPSFYAGLFGGLYKAHIQNLTIEQAEMDITNSKINSGILAAEVYFGKIENCNVQGICILDHKNKSFHPKNLAKQETPFVTKVYNVGGMVGCFFGYETYTGNNIDGQYYLNSRTREGYIAHCNVDIIMDVRCWKGDTNGIKSCIGGMGGSLYGKKISHCFIKLNVLDTLRHNPCFYSIQGLGGFNDTNEEESIRIELNKTSEQK